MKEIQKHPFLTWKLMMLFWFLCLSLQYTACSQGEECSCEVIVKEACTYKIIGKITGKLFEQKRPFNLFYTPSQEAEKVVAALLIWKNSYHCDAAKGYICDEEVISNTFSVSVNKAENQLTIPACLTGTFTFSAEGEDDILCKPTQTDRTPVSHQEYGQHPEKGSVRLENNEAFLRNRTPAFHQDYNQHSEKGSVRLEFNEAFPEKTSENSDEAKSSFGWIGPVAGAVFSIAIIGVAVLFVYQKCWCYTYISNNTSPELNDLE